MTGLNIGGIAFLPAVCSPPVAAFGGSGTAGDPQIYRSCEGDAAGEMTQMTNFSGFVDADACHNPVLSPNGNKILFEVKSSTTGYREVWVVDAVAGSTPTQLVADASQYVIHPAWGADSDTFVYVHCAGGNLNGGTIYKDTVSSPGSPTALKAAAGGISPFRPQFNFDGTRVAYIFNKDNFTGADLRVMDDDGSNDASLDNTLAGYDSNQPPQFSWANTQNLIGYDISGGGANVINVIADDATGKTQINASGDAAGSACSISGRAWPADDSFVLITYNGGTGVWFLTRAEVDGSGTTRLNATNGAINQGYFHVGLVFDARIWFIQSASGVSRGRLSSMALDGTDYVNNFDSNGGSGDQVAPFAGGDGWYYN